MESNALPIPVLLLKTKSTPHDAYEKLFSSSSSGISFAPQFVPVLLHKFEEKGIQKLRSLFSASQISGEIDTSYGGLIFTSQRAVEAFIHVLEENREHNLQTLQHVPIYSVGPATTGALSAISHEPPLQIFGSHTGNGDALAHFILDHYNDWYRDRPAKPRLLFLVGEQRRDIIPRTLMDDALSDQKRIVVDEEVVYGTDTRDSFPAELREILQRTGAAPARWILVFSPTGCEAVLEQLGVIVEQRGEAKQSDRDTKTFIATIGPTTRRYLVQTFNFEPHVCAKTPTPEGILNGILEFMMASSTPS